VPTIADDIIDAIREDEFENAIAQAREHQEAYDQYAEQQFLHLVTDASQHN
jgi:hypothetical protein